MGSGLTACNVGLSWRVLRQFVQANRDFCLKVEKVLPHRGEDILRRYELTVAHYLRALPAGAIVVDAGAGSRCSFYEFRQPGIRIVGVDISESALRENPEIDEWREADITRRLPFTDGEVSLVASKHVLEHLNPVAGFVREAGRVLGTGGAFVSLFPSRFAPYALGSRLLPDRLATTLLHKLHPETRSKPHFRAFYERCSCGGIAPLLRSAGFRIESLAVSYYQSHYFGFLAPLYLLSATWEMMLYYAGARELAATVLVVARKR